jgi:RecG-like helicase
MPEESGPAGLLRRALSRLTASQDELDAVAEYDEATSLGGEPIAECADRDLATVSGTLKSVTLRPRAGIPVLEADLWDGTGMLTLVWLGRRRIAGIMPGRKIVATGRVATADGRRVMYNPRYDLRPPVAS